MIEERGLDAIVGCRVQRIDGPKDNLFALSLWRHDRHGCLILSSAPGRVAWGFVLERPRGNPASAFVLLLRKHLSNAVVQSASVSPIGAQIVLGRGEARAQLDLVVDPANLVLSIDDRTFALRPSGDPRPHARMLPTDFAELEKSGPSIVAAQEGDRVRALTTTIERRVRKLERRREAIEHDLSRTAEIDELRASGSLLSANAHAIARGAIEAEVLDYTSDPPSVRKIRIDPARGPRGEAEALFRRARKLERGARVAQERLEQTNDEIARLLALRDRLRAPEPDLDAIARDAVRLGASKQTVESKKKGTIERRPYRIFRGTGDRTIFVGRSAADNDALTLHVARPHDHWLHAHGVPGSHVVIPLERQEVCPSDLLIDAAHLAAHFSSAREEPLVEVRHVARRHVRKPRGAAPGTVTITREKTIVLRVSRDRLAQLLRSEEP